jgi:protein-tyrosine phosphatase
VITRKIAIALSLALALPTPVHAKPAIGMIRPAPRLASVPNLRDLGGLLTADGRHRVKPGLLYRSDQLDLMTDPDFALLSALKLETIIDFRTESERKKGPDRVPEGTRNMVYDVIGAQGDQAEMMRKAMTAGSATMMTGLYRDFATSPSADAAYRGLLSDIDKAKGPTLFHCTAGKDRTGWGAAVILSLLGVPREAIIADFLISNDRLVAKNEAFFAAHPTIPRAVLEPVMGVRRDYIETSFAAVERKYGSVEKYAQTALGVDKKMIKRLRKHYLIRA